MSIQSNIIKTEVTVEFYSSPNPGNEAHLREVLRNYFSAKGVPTEQEYKDNMPVHNIVIKLD